VPVARSSEVFRPGLGLRARMAVALVLNGVLFVALLALAAVVAASDDGWAVVAMFVMIAFVGATAESRGGRRSWRRREPLHDARGDRIARRVARLCALADLRVPATELVADDAPLSWTTALPFRPPRVHVTTGMATLLPDNELEAVLAHELSHIGNRDAVLMTVLAAPGVFVLSGLRHGLHDPNAGLGAKAGMIMFAWMYAPPAAASALLSRIVSRHRELAADRGAALLTGSPAALASALMRLSKGLRAIPDRDLRVVASADLLHVVPARPGHGIARLWATHPRLEKRIEQLERLEARVQQ
jgi:heat shock protein HtpX